MYIVNKYGPDRTESEIPFRGLYSLHLHKLNFPATFLQKKRSTSKKVLFALKAVPIRIQLFSLSLSLSILGDIRRRRQRRQIKRIKQKTNTLKHKESHVLEKSTAFLGPSQQINKRNSKEMGKYCLPPPHPFLVRFVCRLYVGALRPGLIKNANANFNDSVKINVY